MDLISAFIGGGGAGRPVTPTASQQSEQSAG
jgi:hypothetical protein